MNGGTCVQDANMPNFRECKCAAGYTGVDCETGENKLHQTLPVSCLISTIESIFQQECIPVGCIPPAHLPYPIVSDGGVCATPPEADPQMQTPLMQRTLDTEPPPDADPLDADSSVNRMTHRCRNITLPQTSFAGGKNNFTYFLSSRNRFCLYHSCSWAALGNCCFQ